MNIAKMTRGVLLGAAVALTASLPMAVSAEGHTNAFPGNKGYVGGKSHARPVSNQHYHGSKYGRQGARSRAGGAGGFCPANFYGMYRGTTYCQNGVALPN